jgi:uncharacterized membrane protein YebE (DUF533 family)
MKHIKTLAVVGVLGLAVGGGLAIAQVHRSGAWGHSAMQHHADPASIVEHLTEFFPKIAAFDANKDGQLDATERESLAQAIVDGTLQLPAHAPPKGVNPSAEMMVAHIGEMYAQFAKYDANHDGTLDETEQAAIKTAIEKGELVFPHAQSHQAPGNAEN